MRSPSRNGNTDLPLARLPAVVAMPDDQLAAVISDSATVVPEATGTGAAATLMDATLAEAFRSGIWPRPSEHVRLRPPGGHTCHRRRGFRANKHAIMVTDEPRPC